MIISKILESTLEAGSTSVSFNDSDIPNSIISINCTDPELFPSSSSLSGNVLTLTYDAQTTDKYIAVYLIKDGLEIVDNVTSEDSDKALSAKQGKVLKDAIDNINIPTELEELSDVAISSIQDGQVLAWNDLLQKFVNVNQSGGGSSLVYSEVEQEVGTWLDGRTIYKKSYITTASINITSYNWTSTGISSTGIDMVIQGEFIRIDTKGKIALSYNVDSGAGYIKVMNLSDYALSCSSGSIITLFYVKPVTP